MNAIPLSARRGTPSLVWAETFDVEGDHPGGRVLCEIVEKVQFVEQGLVPDADRLGKPHALAGELDQMVHEDAPALAYEGYVSDGGLHHAFARQEEGVHMRGDVDPETVGADKGERSLLRDRDDSLLQVPPAGFRKPPRDDGCGAGLRPDALGQHIRHEIGPDRDDHKVNRFGDLRDAPVNRLAVHGSAAGVDPVDLHRVAKKVLREDLVGRMAVVAR